MTDKVALLIKELGRMKKILLISLIILGLYACDTNENRQAPIVGGNAELSLTEYTFPPTGGKVELTLTAVSGWTIDEKSPLPSTITISPTRAGMGSHRITITAQQAKADIDQYIKFVNSNDKTLIAAFHITQQSPKLDIGPDTSKGFWWYTSGEQGDENSGSLRIECNTDWKITTDDEAEAVEQNDGFVFDGWLWCSKISGVASSAINGDIIEFIPLNYNIDESEREINLIIEGAAGQKQFMVTQSNMPFVVKNNNFAVESLSFPPCNATPYTTVVSTSFDSWRVVSYPGWLTVSPTSSSAYNTTMTLSARANTTKTPLTDVLRLRAYHSEINPEREVAVTIEPYQFELSETSKNIINKPDGVESQIQLISSGKWEIDGSDIPSWLRLDVQEDGVSTSLMNGMGKEYGEGDVRLVMSPKTYNLDAADKRTATIGVKSTEAGVNFEAVLTVHQDAYELGAIIDKTEIPTTSTDSYDLSIKSSGEWEISDNASWLEFSATSGDGDQTITYRATSQNGDLVDRVATITLNSITHREASQSCSKKYEVKQLRYMFDVTPTPKETETLRFSALDPEEYVFNVVCSDKWVLETASDWIKSNITSYTGNANLTITVDENVINKARTGSFTIKSTYGGKTHTQTYNVSQEAFVFDTQRASVPAFEAVKAAEKKLTLGKIMGRWNVDYNDVDWIRVSPSDGTDGNKELTIVPRSDYSSTQSSAKARTGVVKIVSAENSDYVKEITVTQNVYKLHASTSSVDIPADDVAQKYVTVTCSGTWNVTIDNAASSWLEVSKSVNNLIIKAKSKNTSGKERTADVTISSTDTDVKFVVKVKQLAAD